MVPGERPSLAQAPKWGDGVECMGQEQGQGRGTLRRSHEDHHMLTTTWHAGMGHVAEMGEGIIGDIQGLLGNHSSMWPFMGAASLRHRHGDQGCLGHRREGFKATGAYVSWDRRTWSGTGLKGNKAHRETRGIGDFLWGRIAPLGTSCRCVCLCMCVCMIVQVLAP